MDLEKTSHDLTESEAQSVLDYSKNGCPGLVKVSETDVFGWFELYMAGKTYSEIAQQTKSKKDLIMYMSVKSNWHTKRLDYYNDLANNLLNKYVQAKSKSANTVATMVSALNTYYGDQFDQYLRTKDKTVIDQLDTKMLAQYYKAIEMLDKLMGCKTEDAESHRSTNVNVNIGTNAKVTQVDENTIEVSQDNIGDILKFLAKKETEIKD